ncbi:MAG: FxDxF family PEP-CTERM protein [Myxococcota bacterium]
MAGASVSANDVDTIVPLSGGTNYFGALHTDSRDFVDRFTFVIDGAVRASVSLITIGTGASDLDFLEADLGGVRLTLSPNGELETGFLADAELLSPLVLTVRGASGASSGIVASYAGTIDVRPIPEPSVALLMGVGLSGLALAARRGRGG